VSFSVCLRQVTTVNFLAMTNSKSQTFNARSFFDQIDPKIVAREQCLKDKGKRMGASGRRAQFQKV